MDARMLRLEFGKFVKMMSRTLRLSQSCETEGKQIVTVDGIAAVKIILPN